MSADLVAPSRVVLITGCSSGIGHAAALHLQQRGWTVYATARRVEDLADLKAAGCHVLALDVTDDASMAAAVAVVEAAHGAVGALINNAGYSQSGAVEDVSIDQLRRQFETNVFGLVRMCQLVLPNMRRQRWGKIVNIGSMGGTFTFPGGGAYHASKYAVESLSDALRYEVRGFGINVILVQPGIIKTGFAAAATAQMKDLPSGEAAGPYGAFNAAVAAATTRAYEQGPLAALGGEPLDVARVIERALNARRPKARYAVTASAHALMWQRSLMTDGMWDAFLRANFPQP